MLFAHSVDAVNSVVKAVWSEIEQFTNSDRPTLMAQNEVCGRSFVAVESGFVAQRGITLAVAVARPTSHTVMLDGNAQTPTCTNHHVSDNQRRGSGRRPLAESFARPASVQACRCRVSTIGEVAFH